MQLYMVGDAVVELKDNYGERPDGSHTLWVVRLVVGPVMRKKSGGYWHSGQVAARCCHTWSQAMQIASQASVAKGQVVIIEPGFSSADSMPGAKSERVDQLEKLDGTV